MRFGWLNGVIGKPTHLFNIDLLVPGTLEIVGGAPKTGEVLAQSPAKLWQLARPKKYEGHHQYEKQLSTAQRLQNQKNQDDETFRSLVATVLRSAIVP